MKYIWALFIIYCVYAKEDTSLTRVSTLINKTSQFSKQTSQQTLSAMPNPFSNDTKPSNDLYDYVPSLQAILNTKVLIGDEWLSLNDSIQGYKIIRISPQNITLERSLIHYTIKLNEPIPNGKKGF